MAIQESGEMFLETIYILYQKHGAVRSLDVAEYMNFSKPSVCRAVGLLKKGEYIDRPVRLTDIVPTICHLTDTKMPGSVEGGVIYQALADFDEAKYNRGDEWAPYGRLIK